MKSNPLPANQPTNRTKMFCKVCKDAKKSESVYTSHSVRVGGKVVCPTLLSQECKYCKEKGHTPKHCPKLKGKYNSTISSVKVRFGTTPTASEDAKERARELCSSPPPAPAPIGKKTNYFQLLKVDEETDEETSVIATLKPDYLDIAKERVETFKREWVKTKDAEIETYKKNLENNFPALGQEKTMKIVDAVFSTTTTSQSYSSKAAAASAATTAPFRDRNEREDSPTPSPVSSRSQSPPPAPKKMPKVEEDAKCSKCILGVYGCSKCYPDCPSPSSSPPPDCMGTPSLSPTPPPTTTTTWSSWADVE